MSGYPPIPRDPSGAPLPVVWDDGLQSWKVYEGLMPLETKLAAIESKLLALDSKFADGSAKVALSGTIVSKKHLNASFGNRFYGENIATDIETVQPLVGSCKNMMIYIENNTTAAIAYLHVYGLIAGNLISLKVLT